MSEALALRAFELLLGWSLLLQTIEQRPQPARTLGQFGAQDGPVAHPVQRLHAQLLDRLQQQAPAKQQLEQADGQGLRHAASTGDCSMRSGGSPRGDSRRSSNCQASTGTPSDSRASRATSR